MPPYLKSGAALGVLLMLSAAPVIAQEKLTLERVFASPDLAGPQPRALKLSPDGTLVTLLKPRADEKERLDLWAIDTRTGKQRMLVDSRKTGSGAALSEAEKMQRERDRSVAGSTGITSYDWSPDGKSILVPVDGDLYLAALDGKVQRLTDTPDGELNGVVSPKGGFVSFVRGGNLFVQPIGGAERQVTQGASDTVSWGVAEFVAQEEMDRRTGYWWSPDDSLIAVARVDESPVGIVTRTAIGGEGTTVYQQRYPAAGTPNAIVDLYVMKPDGSGQVKVDLGSDRDIYLARVDWAKDGRTLYVQREARDQKRLDLLAVDPATGKAKVILSETAKSWINLSDNFHPLSGGDFLWWSEKSGHGHLYRVHDGKWTALTSGDWEVKTLVAVDEKAGLAYFTGNRETPLEQQLYSAPITRPAAARQITASGWWNDAVMDAAASRAVITRQNSDQPKQVYLADNSGKQLQWLSENALKGDHPYAPYLASHVKTRFGTIKAADGTTLYTNIMTPPIEPGKRYPVFMIHYGGPGGGRQVTNTWSGALNQYLVDRGWIVFAVDNRGTPDRGKAFEDHLYRAMGTVEVTDQLAGVDWLKAQPFVDPKRIATYGWSYGGYMSLKLLEKAPGVFAAAVAGAPVTKWELYDTHYTERYLGMPQDKPSAYPASGAIDEAVKISDPLMLIHGMSDDNVVFDNATALMAKMQGAAVPFEMMAYPGQTHRVGGPGISVHLWRTIEDFLARRGIAPDAAKP
ncbi:MULTISPECIES: S9 family peptidase [unclassified Sphingobium]|uniref:S9 family peptidase n=1 Tax=unclassified Sphingobium TaxID=2611147 RepID=UPI000D165ABE|nr:MULTISPECIES: S9 family peptidase [unclassified Sphingobium]MBG6116725.1 dipeptidyl-peptidase-4 [Sphingobium sp. JAI105]PSO13113.1 S9 family peptidase [Sphingobium sp. AEW4]TWD07088.1 dipeptidyl-peptidase-4 [Sphingobium sp. AEW010]TWD24463.1 dipeptidyl-peptidase-4 [Sphingobium sp. AEW013]TWD26294.1 dipeptidyl-peptidase-4 [Sphingobium sp. AEW001]